VKALVVKHIDCEGPGVLADVFARHGVELELRCPYRGEPLPRASGYDFLVVLGGPMGVYERDRYPFIDAEAELVRNAVAEGLPVLGLCLGSQIIADALGGRVTRHFAKEIGAMTVDLTAEGRADPLFDGLDASLSVFQWHGDTFSVPPGGVRLAKSKVTANQAFRHGRATYGFQFHLEVTVDMVEAWLAEYAAEVASERLDPHIILEASRRECKRWAETSEIIFSRFIDLR
jgi:GMP synthase-like glutamine amidotransferase